MGGASPGTGRQGKAHTFQRDEDDPVDRKPFENMKLLARAARWMDVVAFGALRRHRRVPLSELYSFSLEVQDATDPPSVAKALVSAVVKAVTPRPVVVFLPQEHGGNLVVAAASAVGNKRHPVLQARSALVAWLQEQNRTVSMARARSLPQWQGLPEHERAVLSGLGIELFVPLTRKELFLGLLVVGEKSGGRRYTPEEAEYLEMIAHIAATRMDSLLPSRHLAQHRQDAERTQRELAELTRIARDGDLGRYPGPGAGKPFAGNIERGPYYGSGRPG